MTTLHRHCKKTSIPPANRQAFKNIVLGALFVGNGSPDFDLVFTQILKELSIAEVVDNQGYSVEITFQPVLFIADLVAKAKVLKMKQCYVFYVPIL